jgi:hypothetical protein
LSHYNDPTTTARKLLISHLTDEQRAELESTPSHGTGSFTVTVPWRNVLPYWRRRFRVIVQNGHNVIAVNRYGQNRERFCLIKNKNDRSSVEMPNEDLALTIMFRLRTRTRRTLALGAMLVVVITTFIVGGLIILTSIIVHNV